MAAYAALLAEAQQVGAKVFFADEAHFRADADLRGKWVLKGEPALVDSSSPRWGEKASYYSAVCLETGEVEVMELQGYSNAETSTAFLKQLRDKHAGPLNVIGTTLQSIMVTPVPTCYPRLAPAIACRDTVLISMLPRRSGTGHGKRANLCLGTRAAVQEKLGHFFSQLASRRERSSNGAGLSCRLGQRSSSEPLKPAPLWLWFRSRSCQWNRCI